MIDTNHDRSGGRRVRRLLVLLSISGGSAGGAVLVGWALGVPAGFVAAVAMSIPVSLAIGGGVGVMTGLFAQAKKHKQHREEWGPDFSVGVHGPNPRVVKELALECNRLGRVFEIRHFPLAPPERSIGITAEWGVQFMSVEGEAGDFLPMAADKKFYSLSFVGPDATGFEGFAGVPENSSDVLVFDAGGGLRWKHAGPTASFVKVCAADINGDGLTEFVLRRMNSFEAFDHNGESLWKTKSFCSEVCAVPAKTFEDDAVVVQSDSENRLLFQDHLGRVIRYGQPLGATRNLACCPWPTRGGKAHLFTSLEESRLLLVYDGLGNLVGLYRTPFIGEGANEAAPTPVRLQPDEPDAFVFVINSREGAALYIHDHRRVPLYIEVLSDPTTGIAAIPGPDGVAECILVGGMDRVWRYRYGENHLDGETSASPSREGVLTGPADGSDS